MTKTAVFKELTKFVNRTKQDSEEVYFLSGYTDAEQLEELRKQIAEFVHHWNNNPTKKTSIVIAVASFSPQIKKMVGLRVTKCKRTANQK